MQNGCICCTLREDLLLEVSNLVAQEAFDHLVIESTGISEPQMVQSQERIRWVASSISPPNTCSRTTVFGNTSSLPCKAHSPSVLQVAETFDMDPTVDGVPFLKGKAHLDNCVTVLDAAELFNNLASIKSLKVSTPMHNAAAMRQNLATSPMQEREKGVTKEDDRNIAELLLDQIEFANVILLNKQDLVLDQISRQTLMATIRTLNPEASVRFTTKCKASTPF